MLIEENSEHEDNWLDSINASSSKEEEEDIDDIGDSNLVVLDKSGLTDTTRVKSNVKGYSKPRENLLNTHDEVKTKGSSKSNLKSIIKRYILQQKTIRNWFN